MPKLLASFTIYYQHGVLMLTDQDATDSAPLWTAEDQIASASESSVLVKVTPAVLGPVTTEVWAGFDGPVPPGVCCFDAAFSLSHGRLRLGDAEDLNRIVVVGDLGRIPVRIYVEPEQFSEQVTVLIDMQP